MKKILSALLILIALGVTASAQEKPNIVLLFVDDLSWNSLGYRNPELFETPNIGRKDLVPRFKGRQGLEGKRTQYASQIAANLKDSKVQPMRHLTAITLFLATLLGATMSGFRAAKKLTSAS